MDPLVLEDSIELLRKIGYSRELSIQALEASGHDLALAMAFCSRNEENAAFSKPVDLSVVKQEEVDEDKFRVAFESAIVAEEFLKDKSSKSSLTSSSLPASSSAVPSSTFISSGVTASESDIKNTPSSQSSTQFSASPHKRPSFFGRLTERFFKGSLGSTTSDSMKSSSPSYLKKSVHFEDELEVAEGQANSYPPQPREQSPSRGTNTFEEVVSEDLLVSLQERYQDEV